MHCYVTPLFEPHNNKDKTSFSLFIVLLNIVLTSLIQPPWSYGGSITQVLLARLITASTLFAFACIFLAITADCSFYDVKLHVMKDIENNSDGLRKSIDDIPM
jgi:hypothetical protein